MEEFFDRLNTWHYKYFKYLKLLALIALLVVFARFLPFLLMLFAPFFIGGAIAKLVEPVVTFLNKKVRLPRFLCSGIAVVLGLAVVGGGLGWLLVTLVREFLDFAKTFPAFYDTARVYVASFMEGLEKWVSFFPDDVVGVINDFFAKFGQNLSDWLGGLAAPITTGAVNFAKNLPGALVFLVTTVLATFFFSKDWAKIRALIQRVLPKSGNRALRFMKNEMIHALISYFKAQFKLMGITFMELLAGFILLRQPYAIFLAALISVIDMLPVLGTGTVLIPWAVISLLMKDYRLAIGLAAIYLVCMLVRQLLEPKILGRQIGIHPLVTLICIYAGLRLYGFLGMILLPVAFLILRNFYYAGAFDWLTGGDRLSPAELAKFKET